MIKERYVSLEVAKLLKDKGFNEDYPKGDCTIYGCTQQMACDQIEEIFNISIELWTGLFGYEMSVRYAKKNFTLTGDIINKEDMPFGDNSDGSWSNKELAYNDMLKYVLTNLV